MAYRATPVQVGGSRVVRGTVSRVECSEAYERGRLGALDSRGSGRA